MRNLLKVLRGLINRRRTTWEDSLIFRLAVAQVAHGPATYGDNNLTAEEWEALWKLVKQGNAHLSVGGGTVEVSVGLRVRPLDRSDLQK